MSPLTPDGKPNVNKGIVQIPSEGRSAGRSELQSGRGGLDTELAEFIAVWPTLPEPIRAAMRALIGAAH